MELLRILTCGSVDDGKSTLIGRLLYDSEAVQIDLLEAIQKTSERNGDERVNLALLTDGLKSEREQGITIDVAYKYFDTDKRKFIIADTPGHIQYTRNMVTGASTANLAMLLVDARKGIIEQTRRHSYITSLLGIPHVVLCINKMDLVDYSEEVYQRIQTEYTGLAKRLGFRDAFCIPISALDGDNIVHRSEKMPFYTGRTVLELLETVELDHEENLTDPRFPVQYVIRPQSAEYPDYRGFAGRIASGVFRKGDAVRVFPSGVETKIKSIDTFDGELDAAFAPMAVTIRLDDEVDASRGSMLAPVANPPRESQELRAKICWMTEEPLKPRGKYLLQHTIHRTKAIIQAIHHRVNIHTLEAEDAAELVLNDLGEVAIKTADPIFYDDYRRNRRTGSFILIDEGTNSTVGAGMLLVD